MSMILKTALRGRTVANMVRNHWDAYVVGWKPWALKCVCISGSSSWGGRGVSHVMPKYGCIIVM